MEDFSKPKIIFQEIVQESQFFWDANGTYMCNDTSRIIVGKDISFLLGILNSKLFFYAVKHFYGGGVLGEHGIRMKHTFFQNFPCIPLNENIRNLSECMSDSSNTATDKQLDKEIYHLYKLSEQEVQTILMHSY